MKSTNKICFINGGHIKTEEDRKKANTGEKKRKDARDGTIKAEIGLEEQEVQRV